MNNLPFDKPGRFYRGNLHTHSTRSDGDLSPEAVCAYYREAGYDFLALTDHYMQRFGFPVTDTRPYRTPDFTTILGAELHAEATEFGELWHLLAVGLPEDFTPPQPKESGPALAARAVAAGAYVAVAHPAWHGMTEADVLSITSAHAIEIFNGVSVDHNDRADSMYMLDLVLTRGRRVFACATDDAHFDSKFNDTLRGWVHVKAETLDPDALLAALKAGAYYSSTGPAIHHIQVIPGEEVTVRCSPAERIFLTGRTWQSTFVHGPGITEAHLSLKNFTSPYGIVTVRDAHGNRAWTNPFWFTD